MIMLIYIHNVHVHRFVLTIHLHVCLKEQLLAEMRHSIHSCSVYPCPELGLAGCFVVAVSDRTVA